MNALVSVLTQVVCAGAAACTADATASGRINAALLKEANAARLAFNVNFIPSPEAKGRDRAYSSSLDASTNWEFPAVSGAVSLI
jgi:hypothetical protein